MSCVQLSEGGFQLVYPLACGPGDPESSKSKLDMAHTFFTLTFTIWMNQKFLSDTKSRA